MEIIQEQIQKNLQKLKDIMVILNFSEEEIAKQTSSLGEVLIMSAWAKASEGKDTSAISQKPTQEELQAFLKANYTPEEIQKIMQEEGEKVIGGYLAEITKGVAQDKLDKIDVVLAGK